MRVFFDHMNSGGAQPVREEYDAVTAALVIDGVNKNLLHRWYKHPFLCRLLRSQITCEPASSGWSQMFSPCNTRSRWPSQFSISSRVVVLVFQLKSFPLWSRLSCCAFFTYIDIVFDKILHIMSLWRAIVTTSARIELKAIFGTSTGYIQYKRCRSVAVWR